MMCRESHHLPLHMNKCFAVKKPSHYFGSISTHCPHASTPERLPRQSMVSDSMHRPVSRNFGTFFKSPMTIFNAPIARERRGCEVAEFPRNKRKRPARIPSEEE